MCLRAQQCPYLVVWSPDCFSLQQLQELQILQEGHEGPRQALTLSGTIPDSNPGLSAVRGDYQILMWVVPTAGIKTLHWRERCSGDKEELLIY